MVVGFLLVKVQVPCVRENFSKVLGAFYCFVEIVHCRVPDLLSSRQMMLDLSLFNERCKWCYV